MSKKLLSGVVMAGLLALTQTVQANGTPVEEVVQPGVEISGAVDVVAGWQHDDQDSAATAGSVGGLADYDGTGAVGNTANGTHYRMVINEVEVDLEKSFGENIRLRSDIDFRNLTDTSGAAGLRLEQAYVTANLAAGNGIEFLIGTFNAPVGVESVDTRDNWTISYAPPFRYMTPANVTGAKLYYAFSDLVDLHFAVVNDLNDNGFAGESAMPSALFRLGFNWGDEGNESTLGISGGVGPEIDAVTRAAGNSNDKHFDFFGDLDFIVALSDTITLAGEGVLRQSNSATGGANQKAIAGLLALNYAASDVWDITFKAGYLWEINPPNARGGTGASTTGGTWMGTGTDGTLYSGTLAAGYMITDGAKLKLEYRWDWFNTTGGAGNNDAMSLLAQFAYTF